MPTGAFIVSRPQHDDRDEKLSTDMNKTHKPFSKCFVVILLSPIILSGCEGFFSKSSLPTKSCPVESVLITKLDLPTIQMRWPDGIIGEPPSRVRADKADIIFSTDTEGGIIHSVYGFWNLQDAKVYYEDDVTGWFTKTKFESEWATPIELQNLPTTADTYDLRCSHGFDTGNEDCRYYDLGCNRISETGNEECRYFARYENFVIELFADITAIDHEKLTQLILKIDKNMNSCFSDQ